MIELEFRQPVAGGGYEVAATLHVHDDGTHELVGTLGLDLTEISILDRDRAGGRLFLADDAKAWARSAHRAFRSGYLVPVIVADDGR
jgi:hypothetical protein